MTHPQSSVLLEFRKWLRKNPALRRYLRARYRQGQYLLARFMGRARQDPLALLWIDPRIINHTIAINDPALTGSQLWHLGTVANGDWDLGGAAVREHDGVYAILQERILNGIPLAGIGPYQLNLARIQAGEIIDSSTTPDEYQERWKMIETLFHTIAAEGYKSQISLGTGRQIDEVRVQVGRSGEFLFEEGLHRLSIAQLLELPQIPVLVTRRHAQWAALREAVRKIVIQRGFFHQPFGHPDLDSLNEIYGSSLGQTAVYGHERWRYIQQNLPFQEGTALDIGAYFGYFCHRLEAQGFDCVAVEPDPENLEVLTRWRDMQGRRFAILDQSIFDIQETHYDLVLALNIFHHLVRTQEDHDKLREFLGRLQCRAMLFEPDDNAGQKAHRHYNDQEFISFVLDHSCLQLSTYLGQAQEGRNVYLLTTS